MGRKSAEYYLSLGCADGIYNEVIDWFDDGITYEEWEANKYNYIDQNWYENTSDYKGTVRLCFKLLENLTFYHSDRQRFIQLSDNHMWDFETLENDDDYWNKLAFEQNELLETAIRDFERTTGVEIYMEGRSGRHICVENNIFNAFKYEELCETQQSLEKWYIEQVNQYIRELNAEAKE